jgi:hypothetical protein
MPHHVYANDNEICSKSADGTSDLAVDVCFSPGAPPPGVPITYMNTCKAGDVTNGSKTVFIKNMEICLEDKSYFSTSYGDEPATQGLKRGVVSTAVQGKCRFVNWSPNVFVEGLAVTRHLDLVTHNHNSPANTATMPYVSRSIFGGHDCKDEEKKIERECKKDSDQSEHKQKMKGKKKFPNFPTKKHKAGKWHWTDDHCAGLQIPSNTISPDELKKHLTEAQNLHKEVLKELTDLTNVGQILAEQAQTAGLKAAGKWLAKAGAKQLGGSSIPVAGNIAMAVWSVADGIMAISDINELKTVITELPEKMKSLTSSVDKFKDIASRFDPSDEKSMRAAYGDLQDAMATMNDCTRARKCNLVPYKKKGGNKDVEPATDGGCCPGQTGHHLIYGAMAKNSCANYDHGLAPTVCAEGGTQHHGSHSRVHDKMDAIVSKLAANGKLKNGQMTMDQAIEAAAESHKQAFPLSGCSKKCIKAQLAGYYKNTCPNGKFDAVDKTGAAIGDVNMR